MSKVTQPSKAINAITQQVKAMTGEPIPANPVLVLNAESLSLLAEIGHITQSTGKIINKSIDIIFI